MAVNSGTERRLKTYSASRKAQKQALSTPINGPQKRAKKSTSTSVSLNTVNEDSTSTIGQTLRKQLKNVQPTGNSKTRARQSKVAPKSKGTKDSKIKRLEFTGSRVQNESFKHAAKRKLSKISISKRLKNFSK